MSSTKRLRVEDDGGGEKEFVAKCVAAAALGKYMFTDDPTHEALVPAGMQWHAVTCRCKYTVDAAGATSLVSIKVARGLNPRLDKAATKQLRGSSAGTLSLMLPGLTDVTLQLTKPLFFACTKDAHLVRTARREAKQDKALIDCVVAAFADHPWQWLVLCKDAVTNLSRLPMGMQCIKVQVTHMVRGYHRVDSDYDRDKKFGERCDWDSVSLFQVEVTGAVLGMDKAALVKAIEMEAPLQLEHYVCDLNEEDIDGYISDDSELGKGRGSIISTWLAYIAPDHVAREARYPHDEQWNHRRQICDECQETLFLNPEAETRVQVSQFDYRADPWFAETMATQWKVDALLLDVTIDTACNKRFDVSRVPDGVESDVMDILNASLKRYGVEVHELEFGKKIRVHTYPGVHNESVVVKDFVVYFYKSSA